MARGPEPSQRQRRIRPGSDDEPQIRPTTYRITVRGRLTERLGSAFEGLDLEPGTEHTALVGEIRDQSHLYGVLDLVRGLGLELVSVETSRAASEPCEN